MGTEPWFRSLLWLARVAAKRWLARRTLIIEFCKYCGRRQPLVWTADDALWESIWGSAGGVLCPECFTRRADAMGLSLRWIPRIEAGS